MSDQTKIHISEVRRGLLIAIAELSKRAVNHDQSKLSASEKEIFDAETPKLAKLTYGSDEYAQSLSNLAPALKHHYENNSHHPEHYADGILGFDVFDFIEFIIDCVAAAKRHNDGDPLVSLEINSRRFNMSDQTKSIIKNTLTRYPELHDHN